MGFTCGMDRRGRASDASDVEANTGDVFPIELAWSNIGCNGNDHAAQRDVSGASGIAKGGRLFAIMGPSGSGKTTLLDTLAQRRRLYHGVMTVNGVSVVSRRHRHRLRMLSAYAEQDVALIGSLLVEETLDFSRRLAVHESRPSSTRYLDTLVLSSDLKRRKVGTILGGDVGLSGGEKKVVDVATQLATGPEILFLDEPTSGLDSTAAFDLVSSLRLIAQEQRIIIIAAVHQPSEAMFAMFDDLLLLHRNGEQIFSGPVSGLAHAFRSTGETLLTNGSSVAERLLDFANRPEHITLAPSEAANSTPHVIYSGEKCLDRQPHPAVGSFTTLGILLRRALLKATRDATAYGIRVAMYLSLALLMGTVWLRLSPTDGNIPAFVNAIFFGGAFMSFMSVAYVPAYLEDRAVYLRERSNGLYGPSLFLLTNFLVGLPFLFSFAVLFSSVTYWLCHFRPSLDGFCVWVLWIFLDLVAAESLVVLVSSIVPVFVASLALTAFLNGIWMCTGGFLVPAATLNPFWKYGFHYIDYQSYVFQGMMVNEFAHRTFSCTQKPTGECYCLYQNAENTGCSVEGKTVLSLYDIGMDADGIVVRIAALLCIISVLRTATWLTLKFNGKVRQTRPRRTPRAS